MPEDDKMLIVPLGGDESKTITQAIANDTARKILELLAESAMSTSSIAKKLDIPLTTVQYNIEKLMEAGLVIVEKTKYSEKGREVKMYAPAKRMIVLVPKTASSQSLIDALKKYFVLLPIAAVAALFIEVAMQLRNGASILGAKLPGGEDLSTYKSAGDAGDSLMMATMNNTYNYDDRGIGAMPASAPVHETAGWANNATDGVASTGSVSGLLPTGNTGEGLSNSYTAIVNASNNSEAYSSIPVAAVPPVPGAKAADPTMLTQHAPPVPDTSTVQGLIPTDLLNHWSLWFFVGCLLMISILVVYELYNRRKTGKK